MWGTLLAKLRERNAPVATRAPEPSVEERLDVPPETAEQIEDGEHGSTEDRIMGESSWLRTSG